MSPVILGLKHEELTQTIIRVFYEVYNELGFGFLESVYEESMRIALLSVGLEVERQQPITVWFRGFEVGLFRADLVVEKKVILELKAHRSLEEGTEAQLLNYLRATDVEVGLLLNFGRRPEFRRVVFDNDRKRKGAPARAGSRPAQPDPDASMS